MQTRLSYALLALLAAASLHGEVAGVVTDLEGHGLPGCTVAAFATETHDERARRLVTQGERPKRGTAATNAEGRFSLPDTGEPFVELEVHCSGRAPQATRVRGSRADVGTLAVLPLSPITGRVSASGDPVEGATVTFYVEDGAEVTTTTDASGAYSVPDPRGWARELAIAHPRFAPLRITRADGRFETTHALEPRRPASARATGSARVIAGSVVDAATRRAVAGLELHLSAGGLIASAITNAEGEFRFEEAPAGAGLLSARSPDYALEHALGDAGDRPLKLAATPLAAVIGRVVEADGTPVAGATVSAVGEESTTEGARAPVTLSGPDGRFVLRGVGASASVRAARAGFSPRSTEPLTLAPGETRDGLELRLDPAATLRGVVLDSAGAVAGATVALRALDDRGRPAVTTHSDSRGAFTLATAPGRYEVAVEKDGYAPATRHVALERGDHHVEVTLERAVELSGRVVRTGSSAGVANVDVSIDGTAAVRARTDAEGAFAIRAAAGDVRLVVSKQDELLRITRDVQAPDAALLIEVPQPRSLRGRVLDRATGQPLREFVVDAKARAAGSAMQSIRGSGGAFSIALPAGAEAELRISAPEHAAVTRVVPPGEHELEVELDRAGAVEGRATRASGEPLEGVEITVHGADELSARSDGSGRFSIAGVPLGRTRLVARKSGFLAIARELQLTAGNAQALELVLEPAAVARGVVLDETGTTLAAARVEVKTLQGDVVQTTVTATDGRFTLDDLADGRYAVRASKQGFVDTSRETHLSSATETTITLRRGGRVIGKVTGLSAPELARAQVIASGAAGTTTANVAADGSFVVEGVTRGTVYLIAELPADGGLRTTETVSVTSDDAGERSATLVFRASPAITGSVTRNGVPLAGAVVRFAPRDPAHAEATVTTNAAGAYIVRGLSAGEYDVEARAEGAVQRVSLRVSGSTTVDIALP